MYQIFFGFCAGVYVGTYYDCKPCLSKVQDMIKNLKNYMPPPKN